MIRTVARLAMVAVLTMGLSAVPACSTPQPGHPVPTVAPMAACTEEDGSGAGQSFPCRWSGGSNGQGQSFTLDAPICTAYEVALSDESHRRGLDIRLACDDTESVRSDV